MKEIILNITVTVNIRIPLPPEERERPNRPRGVRHENDKAA